MNKLISIIIPNFNKDAFIEQTLTSVSVQTYSEWEAIIIDDGSTDSSISIINEFVKEDRRFKVHKRDSEVKGASSCRNIGLDIAKGDFVIFLDSDDILLPNCLKNRMAAFNGSLEMDFIVFPMGTFYEEVGDNPMVWRVSTKSVLDKFLSHSLPWTIVSPIWKKSAIEKLNGFDPRYDRLQDVEFHTRALLLDDVKFELAEGKPDSFYRIGEDRKNTLPEEFYSTWVDSASTYIDTMKEQLLDLNKSDKVFLLKGTLVRTLTSMLYANKMNRIDDELLSELLSKLIDKAIKQNWKSRLLRTYISLYKRGFYKLKGFNFLFQNSFIYLQ